MKSEAERIRKLTDDLAEARETIRQLQDAFGTDDRTVINLRLLLRIQPARARILACVMKRPHGVSYDQLAALLQSHRPSGFAPTRDTLGSHICLLRQALAPHGIEIDLIWGTGIRLNATSLNKLTTMLSAYEAAV